MTQLFAERFTEVATDGDHAQSSFPVSNVASVYDEQRDLSVTPDGSAVVELSVSASTQTITKVEAEQSDDDRAWHEINAGVGTRTSAGPDKDRW